MTNLKEPYDKPFYKQRNDRDELYAMLSKLKGFKAKSPLDYKLLRGVFSRKVDDSLDETKPSDIETLPRDDSMVVIN